MRQFCFGAVGGLMPLPKLVGSRMNGERLGLQRRRRSPASPGGALFCLPNNTQSQAALVDWATIWNLEKVAQDHYFLLSIPYVIQQITRPAGLFNSRANHSLFLV